MITKEERKQLRRTQILLLKSLDEKWNNECEDLIPKYCPFCYDAIKRNSNSGVDKCNYCLCPRSICADYSNSGYIFELRKLNGFERNIKELPSNQLNHMRSLFFKEIIKINTFFRLYR